jgi:hypothetical protein
MPDLENSVGFLRFWVYKPEMADGTTPAQDGWGPSPIPGLLPQIDFEVPADNKVFTVIDPPRGRPAGGGGVHRRLKPVSSLYPNTNFLGKFGEYTRFWIPKNDHELVIS